MSLSLPLMHPLSVSVCLSGVSVWCLCETVCVSLPPLPPSPSLPHLFNFTFQSCGQILVSAYIIQGCRTLLKGGGANGGGLSWGGGQVGGGGNFGLNVGSFKQN